MAIQYNQLAYRVTAADVQSITLFNVVMTKSADENGAFVFEGYHNTGGCGSSQDSGLLILIKDVMPWSKMCFKWEGTGSAACWSFMDANTHFGASTGTPTGNMLAYNESLGDRLHDNFLSWEVPAYQSHNRTTSCDNNENNFFRFNANQFRKFRMTRRRNVGMGPAGIHHGRSCNTSGVTAVTRISEIFLLK